MDTFVDSSWYFLRYCDADNDEAPWDKAVLDRWMPVDQYIGGVEHAILHLLYCRFLTKVLFDMEMVGFTEPMLRLMNQGQVIFGGASMSKSKGNIVEPMPLVERWGADTMRLNILFAGPFEDESALGTIARRTGEVYEQALRAQRKHDEQRPELRSRQRDRPVLARQLQRAEQPHVHHMRPYRPPDPPARVDARTPTATRDHGPTMSPCRRGAK